jgi:hypothetical protein
MIKEILALLVFLPIVGLTIYLAVKKRIGNALTTVLLVFSLLAGLAIANYDSIGRAKWEFPGFSLFRDEVSQVKSEALQDLQKEVESQRQAIKVGIADLNATNERLDAGIKYAEALLESIKRAEERLKIEEFTLREQGLKSDRTAEQATAVYRAVSELALLLTKVTWLQLQARDESDARRRDAAVRQVMDQLDSIVDLVIEDPDVKSEFVNSVMGSLPPRK